MREEGTGDEMAEEDELAQQIREYLGYPSVQFDEAMLMLNRLVPQLLARNRDLTSEVKAAINDYRREHTEVERLREELEYKEELLAKAVRQFPNFTWHE